MDLMKTSDENFDYIIYCDGACSGNPGPGGWGSILLNTQTKQVLELGDSNPHTTNNQMELSAVISSLKKIKSGASVLVLTDSVYVIRGITQWIFGWLKRNWTTAEGGLVSNKELWQNLFTLSKKFKMKWRYTRGHVGIPGNERCDVIAVAFSKHQYIDLYEGSFVNYDVSILPLPVNEPVPDRNNKSSSGVSSSKADKKKMYYLTYVNGMVSRFQTWSECERTVKGMPGAKFKKVSSLSEEQEVLKSWHVL
jgi:ribonuclease HI